MRGDLKFSCAATGSPATGPTGQGVLAYFDIVALTSLNQPATDANGAFTFLHDVSSTTR